MSVCCGGEPERKRRLSWHDLVTKDEDDDTAYGSDGSTRSSSSAALSPSSGGLWSPPGGFGPRVFDTALSREAMEGLLDEVAGSVKPWRDGSFAYVKKLQDAEGNFGHVDMMRSEDTGAMVAVKRMPNHWVCSGPRAFYVRNPEAAEQPWLDLALLKHLNKVNCPYVCQLAGIFRDDDYSYVVTSLATDGDLFAWCSDKHSPGAERERILQPVVAEAFSAVRCLHGHGIAHRDLSLENILLTAPSDGRRRVRIIDFGMATVARWCVGEVRGKVPYRAPEMHEESTPYCPFKVDAFALGVTLFSMATSDYPWQSTKRGKCKLFEYIRKYGVREFLERRKCRKTDGLTLVQAMSPELLELVQGLLELDPTSRLGLGGPALGAATCDGAAKTVWQAAWFAGV